ncbi:amylo-alpha-1,6-glucosidase [Pseudogracilibacillus auburnensis]|uniref:amylo-alpha-1,6-glucosidase n=1 Tax=Pseudogracilibacillus auburnensis TaxID=1494959 RepID=UPI001A975906|nr:amylo-alpha-1,6-glucosidase [Pseudogracilibacillus auburnensis]MBO1005703.1 amylo-alpha-1,6-glucosidase [Pseudogracilibacillus auburnensis]
MNYRVIKENDLFFLTDTKGNIPENHYYGHGLYTKDTRFLSQLDLKINGEDPILLSSDAGENYMAKILLTNPHMENKDELILWRESVEIERTRFIYDDVLYETIKVKNYYPKPISFQMSVHMDVDFSDMFTVRGFENGKVGKRTGQTRGDRSFSFHYLGADDVKRSTNITWDRDAADVTDLGDITFDFHLGHEEEDSFTLMIKPEIGESEPKNIIARDQALTLLEQSYEQWSEKITKVQTDYEPLQRLVDRGIGDLRVLLTDLGYGQFPVAGLPWFGVPFGRDSLIAALQMLPFEPEVAKGTLFTLAAKQGERVDPVRDEQPGKIMHELRFGELAATGQIPFAPYYGTIDATPLFLVLLTEYVKWTGDLNTVKQLQGNIDRALEWIDQYGDRDGDGFVEYFQEASKGIANQGWKDSGDSIVHRNGEYADAPIALSEVQGYVYHAKVGVASLFEQLGENDRAQTLRNEAEKLKAKFEAEFWMDEVNFYAIALDKEKQQVGTITSNPGHILFSDMISEERAGAVVDTLISDKMFSGFGIRTMGEEEAGYNPMSYHDGSIWPHDNSMILLGMSKLGYEKATKVVIDGLIKAAGGFEYDRLPELFCGYSSERGRPVKYPVACSPQAWAAGTPLVFIQSLLGLFPNSLEKQIHLEPNLLDEMNFLKVEDISIGNGHLSIEVRRTEEDIEIDIVKNTTGYEVFIK